MRGKEGRVLILYHCLPKRTRDEASAKRLPKKTQLKHLRLATIAYRVLACMARVRTENRLWCSTSKKFGEQSKEWCRIGLSDTAFVDASASHPTRIHQ